MRAGGPQAQLEVGITGPRPDAILEVETGAVGRLGESKELEIGIRVSGNRLLLVFAAAGDDLENHALTTQIRSAESIDAADLSIEGWIARLYIGIPDQIRELIALRCELKVGRAAGADVSRI